MLKHRDKYSSEEIYYIGTKQSTFDLMPWKTKRKVQNSYDETGRLRPGFYTVFVSRVEMEENGLLPITEFPVIKQAYPRRSYSFTDPDQNRDLIKRGGRQKNPLLFDFLSDKKVLDIRTGSQVLITKGHQRGRITHCKRKSDEEWIVFGESLGGLPLTIIRKMLEVDEEIKLLKIEDDTFAHIFNQA